MRNISIIKRALAALGVSAVCLGFATASVAQSAGPSGSAGTLQLGSGKRTPGAPNIKLWIEGEKEILPTLNLSADQQSKIADLGKATLDSIKAIRQSTDAKEVKQQKVRDAAINYRTQLFQILTKPQGKQFREEMKAFIKKWHDEHKKPGAAPATGNTGGTAPSGGKSG